MKKNFSNSLADLFENIQLDTFTKQTLVSLFRCMAETVVDTKSDAVALVKLNDKSKFDGLISRLKFSGIKVYDYSDNLSDDILKNDEFLVIMAERFSVCLFWDKIENTEFELCQGLCSLDPAVVKKLYEFLQAVQYNEELDSDILKIKQDRRQNEKFTSILNKLVALIEGQQRDLICLETENAENRRKTEEKERLANIGYACSAVAHEIRNPLSLLSIYSKVINTNLGKLVFNSSDLSIKESILNATQSITNAVTSLDNLLSELLDYSKPLELNLKENNIEKTVDDVISLVNPWFKEKNINLVVKKDLHLHTTINFDQNRIHQALINLLKNALEASPENSEIEIDLTFNEADEMLYIKVKDQGNGIAKQDRDKIFKPYFSTKKKGTGIGLARAKEILELHNGSLSLLSSDEKGTVFVFKLPTFNY
ncbi:MAG: ATP-binding protein [bacterium]